MEMEKKFELERLMKKYVYSALKGDEKTINELADIYKRLTLSERKVFQEMFDEEALEQLGISGGLKEKTGYRLNSFFHLLHSYPFFDKEEDKIAYWFRKLKIEEKDFKPILLSYENFKKSMERKEISRDLGYVLSALGGLSHILGQRFLGKILLGAGGISELISLYEQGLNEYSVKRLLDLDNIVAGVVGGFGVAQLLTKTKNPFASAKFFEIINNEKVAVAQRLVENGAKLEQNIIEFLQKKRTEKFGGDIFKPVAEFVSESKGLFSVMSDRIQQLDTLAKIKSSLENYPNLIKYFAGDKVNLTAEEKEIVKQIQSAIDLSQLKKYFYLFNPERVEVKALADEKIRAEFDNLADLYLYLQKQKEKGLGSWELNFIRKKQRRTPQGLTIEEEEKITRYFTGDYKPSFAGNIIIKANKGGEFKNFYANEFDFYDVVDELVEKGYEIERIYGPNFQAFSTRKIAEKIAKEVAHLYEEADDKKLKDLILNSFRSNIHELKKEVWALNKKTEKGFFEVLDKLEKEGKIDEKDIERLKEFFVSLNLSRKISFNLPLQRSKELIERLAVRGTGKEKMILNLLEKLEAESDVIKNFEKFSSHFRTLWLTLNFPVRLMNSLSMLTLLGQRYLISKGLEGFGEFMSDMLSAFARGGLNFAKSFRKRIELSPLEFFNLTIKAPFEEATEEIAKVISQKYQKILFGTENIEPSYLLNAFLFSEGALSKPLFMYQKIAGIPLEILDHISAFFTANYVPFYTAMKNWVQAGLKLFTARGIRESLVPISSAIATSSFLAMLIGAKHTAPFSFLYDIYNVSEQLGVLIGQEPSHSPVPQFLIDFTKEGFGLNLGLFGTGDILIDTAIGSGILGGLLQIRTAAGATALPSIGDAPLLQIAQDILNNKKQIEFRIRRGEIEDIEKYYASFVQSLIQNSGIIRKIIEESLGKFNAISHLPPAQLTQSLKRILVPPQISEFTPVGISLRDKLTIKSLREGDMKSLSYVFGILREAEKRKGVEFLKSELFETMRTGLKKLLKGGKDIDEDDVLNFVYLTALHSYLEGYEGKEILSKTLGKNLNEKLLAYYDDIRKKIEISARMMRYERR